MGRMLSISEVSELVGVTVKTLKIWDNKENLKAKYKTAGGHRRYDLDDIEKSIKELSIERNKNSENNNESNINK
jgi:DNA-binding transcriptional MerR regulator